MLNIERLLIVVFCAGLCAAGTAPALASGVPACPAGQVPTWNNSGCMAPQTPTSLSGYGMPTASSKSSLPGGSVNSNPAMQDCNGIPIPLGQPCSAAKLSLAGMPVSSISSMIASQTQSTASHTAPSPTIVVSPGQPGVGPLSTTPATAAPAIDATATLTNLLGDWYTGWLQYLAGAFNFSPATQASISTTFLGFTACLQAQQQACEDAVWQSISQWIGPSLPQTSNSGS